MNDVIDNEIESNAYWEGYRLRIDQKRRYGIYLDIRCETSLIVYSKTSEIQKEL